jgi:hypothetical protein
MYMKHVYRLYVVVLLLLLLLYERENKNTV